MYQSERLGDQELMCIELEMEKGFSDLSLFSAQKYSGLKKPLSIIGEGEIV